jgi:hypothetical protein
MTATYTFDVFSSLGPELLDRRPGLYGGEQRMVFGANTYREFTHMLADSTEESDVP